MPKSIILPVNYRGEELEFNGTIINQGDISKLLILINDADVVFEKDENSEYRGIVLSHIANSELPEEGLIKAISEVLNYVSRS